jgi:Na+-translocating ferredoxin:NAD+ oxidoreductase RnfD subunit
MSAVSIRGTTYPVVLPKLTDPRLHLAAVITTLQVLGQVAFHFRLSIAQILVSLLTCAVLEVAITLRRQHVLMWPASALLTGNGVAFILRVPGTQHGDWWSMNGWWIFMATAAVSLLSKYVIVWRGAHVFNPSNFGLVLCFLVLGRTRAEPLDFWWGPMSGWMALALAVILVGGFAILSRLRLLWLALAFWATFAAGIAALAAGGHELTARWHLGPLSGFELWWVLVTSPEVLVFLFFMITDPKTAPRGARARIVYAVSLGLLAVLLIAPTQTEYAAKVGLLSALALVCAVKPFLAYVPRRRLVLAAATAALVYPVALVAVGNGPGRATAAPVRGESALPVTIERSRGVQTQLDRPTAAAIARGLLAAVPARAGARLRVHLEPGSGQGPPVAVAQLAGRTYRLSQAGARWALQAAAAPRQASPLRMSPQLAGIRLEDVATQVGLDFQQGSFRYGVTPDYRAMMGGGVCWLDYDGDGWLDLFAVNSYASSDSASYESHGGLPESMLFRNDHGTFHAVHTGLRVQGDGCAAADLDGDGRPDLVVTTTSGVEVLWNEGGGHFAEQTLHGSGWYAGVAIADVNGDGRPDVFAAGYADPSQPVPGSLAGFPTNLAGVRDLLFLNTGGRTFREAGAQAGLEAANFDHGLGATFVDVNHDGRPDLYVANDEDPNRLYVNVPWPGGPSADPLGLGFRFDERGTGAGVADPNAGMGVATADLGGRLGLLVTNSRNERTAAYLQGAGRFADARPLFDPALGTAFAGWGVSFADLANSGRPDLVLAAGAIPVTSLAQDAEPLRVLAPARGGYGMAGHALDGGVPALNGRGLAVADAGNDGRLAVAVNTIGGKLVLLRPQGHVGHWLDVEVSPFVAGATVTVALPGGARQTRMTASGTSYLSSEDPRVHFGLGAAEHVARVVVRLPWGASETRTNVRADQIVTVAVPPRRPSVEAASSSSVLAGCKTPARTDVVRYWNAAAVAALRTGGASDPVQARNLFDVSRAMSEAWHRTHSSDAVSFAAYRLLLWRASLDRNLQDAFADLTGRLRRLCYDPAYTSTRGDSPPAVGNRIAAAAIAAGRGDGSNEALRYADTTYVSQNAPLVLSQPGTTAHDPTFWQPLALGRTGQRFEDAQWGRVRGFGATVLRTPASPLPTPDTKAYRKAALAVLHATAGTAPPTVDASPAGWNDVARTLPSAGVAQELRRLLALNGALHDAAIATWRAKRVSQAPRPVSMIRAVAFAGRLPAHVRERGRLVRTTLWTSPSPTPASPGWVSEDAAFAAAAQRVLGQAVARQAAARVDAGLAGGIDTPAAVAAGKDVGRRAGERALRLASAP